MKFTVTPLGGGRGDMVRVIESIVRYLQPPPAPPPGGPDGRSPAGGGGPERYYADGGEEAGRWLGRTAAASGLTGAVQRDDFAAVLAGRDPHTGERLITAQGSAGRRPSLGAGAFSRVGNDAEPLFDVADSAAVLGVSHRELERMLDIGTAVALAAVVPTATRHAAGVRPPGAHPGRPPARLPGAPTPQPEASYLVPVIDADGSRWVSASELSRCQTARADWVSPGAVRSLGAADDQIALAEAARLAGVTTRYLRGLARHPEQHRTEIVNALAAGRRPRKAYLVGHRGAKGRWLVTRENLAGFLERRRPPPVRVAYDLTLTTEKSLGVLALLGTEPVRAGVLDSIQAGNDWALRWIEDHAVGRIHGAAAPAEGLMVASFRHLTSRALDPFPHHHNVAAGYRVVGTAVKGEAARALAAATGIECETVAWHLAHTDPQNLPLDARTILVVDEASTLHDRALDQLMAMAAQTGASVRLVSDPAQHGAIAAGGMFRVLCERHPQHAPELTTTHRLQHPHDRAAAEALRQGRIDEAFDLLAAAGHLHVVDDDLTMYRHVLARWWDAHRAGFDHPMVDRRNSTRRQLNRLAHLLRQVNGELGADEIKASGYRQFSVGDRVTARAPNRQLHVPGDRRAHVRNGALGTVVAVTHQPRSPDGDTLTVEFDGIGIIDIPRAFFDHHRTGAGRTEVGIDHAYALTSYAVQGSTRSISTSRVDATATRAETYVDITRGRDENHLYLTAASDPLDGEALPRAPAPPADVAVADRLHRSTGELTAWGLAHPAEDTGALDRAIGQ